MKKIIYLLFALTFVLTACSDDDKTRVLQRDDVTMVMPENGWVAEIGKPFVVRVNCNIEEGITYRWFLDEMYLGDEKDLTYTFKRTGKQCLKLIAIQDRRFFEYAIIVEVKGKEGEDGKNHSPFITKVLEYVPAPSQYTNKYPAYSYGDTPMDMNNKVLDAIGNGNLGVVTLGGYGGYVVVGFDHTIKNVPGKRDFRVLGNMFDIFDNASSSDIARGGAEPGIIMVAYDKNKNGRPDDEWYEIEGSAHNDFKNEPWYDDAVAAHNDVKTIKDYSITYFVPEKEPELESEWSTYLRWEDNQGKSGYVVKNGYHDQSYYPQWILKDQLTFSGTRLPQNAVDTDGSGNLFYAYNFRFGYADNAKNESKQSTIDIDWAVNKEGKKANLPGVDFIKIYTGVRQRYGTTGECSTEISGIEDLHILSENIDTYQ